MSSVDNRVVEMSFNNSTFEQKVASTLGMLDKLKSALNFTGAGKSMGDLQGAANRLDFGSITGGVDKISASFVAMSTVAITALANIANRAVDAGINLVKGLSLEPVMAGFSEYELKMGSIQTIMANTSRYGTTLEQVTTNLDDLNTYADKTIYNFGDMTKNIGLFTNAGLRVEEATSMIKGFSNEAAASGTSAEGAASAAYQLSQALSAGQIRLMDWRSLQNVGMGNKNMQNGVLEIADAMGTLEKAQISSKDVQKDFNGSLEKGWLSADVMSNYLKIMAGDMSKAQIKALGVSDATATMLLKQSKMGEDAATKVRTLSQLMGTLKESVGSSWASTFDTVFGDFNEATELFTNVNNVIGGFVSANSDARNKVLKDWADLGGRANVIKGISNIFQALMDVLSPISKAFRDIFPAKTGQDLFEMSRTFRKFTQDLSLGEETMTNLRRTFAGVFAIFSIGWQVVKGIAGVFADLFGMAAGGAGGFLELTGTIGDFFVGLDAALKKGDGLKNFFDGVSVAIQFLLAPLGILHDLLVGLFVGASNGGGAEEVLGRLEERLSPLAQVAKAFGDAWDALMDKLAGAGGIVGPIAQAFSGIGDAISGAIDTGDFSGVLDLINTGLLGAIVLLLRNFAKNGLNFSLFGDGDSGMFAGIKDTFETLTGSLKAMQTQIQAKTLILIAGAIALITASVVALSLIDSKALTKALTAMSVGFAQLLGAMGILVAISGSAGFVKVPLIAGAMVLLATSILILSGAIKILSSMSWEELTKGLVGVAGAMIIMTAGMNSLSGISGGILRAGLAMIPLAIALNILAGAMKIFATMSWGEMAKGMVGVAGGLAIIAATMNLMPKSLPLTAAGLVIVAGALAGLAGVMKLFAALSWGEMGKGMAGIGGGLLIIAAAMNLMPLSLPVTAAGLVLVAAALGGIAAVSQVFANMSWEEMGKAAAALAGSLLIIAGGLYLMSGTVVGSAALLVAAGALSVLTPVLVTLGSLSWESIAKGLAALAGAFVVLGLAGLVLTPLVLPLMGLSVALLAIGAGMALAGVGALALATAFAIFTAAGTAGIAMIGALIALIPSLASAFAQGIVDFSVTLAQGAGDMIKAWVDMLGKILDGVIKIIPKVGKVLETLIRTGARVIINNAGVIAEAGVTMLLRFLEALRNHIDEITDVAGDLIAKFIKGLGRQATKIQNAAAETIIDFINGTADAIRAHSAELGEAGANLATAIIEGMARGIAAGAGVIKDKLVGVAKDALSAAKNFLGINSPSKVFRDEVGMAIPEGIAVGVKKYGYILDKSVVEMAERAKNKTKEHLKRMSGPAGKAYEQFGEFLMKGFADGLVGGSEDLKQALKNAQQGVKAVRDVAKQQIKDAKEDIKRLNKAKKKDPKALKKAKEELADAQAIADAADKAQKAVETQVKAHQKNLTDLGKQWDVVSKKLADAEAELKKRQDELNNYRDSATKQFDVKPDISAGMNLNNYLYQVQQKTLQTQKFMETLAKLRELGLDDNSYKQIMAEGLDAQALMDQLIAGGGASVQKFNEVNANLASIASTLGTTAANTLYQAGVDSAQGLVNGFKSEQANLEAQMDAIAKAMIKAIKKRLKIKSPSQAFAEVGEYSSKGLAGGMRAYSGVVEKAAVDLGDQALATLRSSMSRVGDAVSTTVDMSPTITPVLDLAKLQKDATKIGTMLATSPLQADLSYQKAAAYSADVEARPDVAPAEPTVIKEITQLFDQTLISPEPLSPGLHWRQTKSVMSLAKEALNV